jgi:segregation and condensation protein B
VTPLAKLLEAALFASARPIATEELAVLERDASPAELHSALDELREHYDVEGHGVELVELGGGWQILTRAEYTEAIERAQLAARPARLSGAALETLAIIAYRQPVTRGDIENIRGVTVSSNILQSLEARGWIDVVGHREVPGRPQLFATTKAFLDDLNLRSLEELPPLEDLGALVESGPAGQTTPADSGATPDAEEQPGDQDTQTADAHGDNAEMSDSDDLAASDLPPSGAPGQRGHLRTPLH